MTTQATLSFTDFGPGDWAIVDNRMYGYSFTIDLRQIVKREQAVSRSGGEGFAFFFERGENAMPEVGRLLELHRADGSASWVGETSPVELVIGSESLRGFVSQKVWEPFQQELWVRRERLPAIVRAFAEAA